MNTKNKFNSNQSNLTSKKLSSNNTSKKFNIPNSPKAKNKL